MEALKEDTLEGETLGQHKSDNTETAERVCEDTKPEEKETQVPHIKTTSGSTSPRGKTSEESSPSSPSPVSITYVAVTHGGGKPYPVNEALLPSELRDPVRFAHLPPKERKSLRHNWNTNITDLQDHVLGPDFGASYFTMFVEGPIPDKTSVTQTLIVKHALARRVLGGPARLRNDVPSSPRIIVITPSCSRARDISRGLKIALFRADDYHVTYGLAIDGKSADLGYGVRLSGDETGTVSPTHGYVSNDIQICTPGKLMDVLTHEEMSLSDVTLVVYDKAEELFGTHVSNTDGHMREAMRFVQRQAKISKSDGSPIASLLLTAAMPASMMQSIVKDHLHDTTPVKVITRPESIGTGAVDKVTQKESSVEDGKPTRAIVEAEASMKGEGNIRVKDKGAEDIGAILTPKVETLAKNTARTATVCEEKSKANAPDESRGKTVLRDESQEVKWRGIPLNEDPGICPYDMMGSPTRCTYGRCCTLLKICKVCTQVSRCCMKY